MSDFASKATARLGLVLLLPVAIGSSACVKQRTVTQGGRTVEKKYVVQRPVKNFIQNVEVE